MKAGQRELCEPQQLLKFGPEVGLCLLLTLRWPAREVHIAAGGARRVWEQNSVHRGVVTHSRLSCEGGEPGLRWRLLHVLG